MKNVFAAMFLIGIVVASMAITFGKSDALHKDNIVAQEINKGEVELYKITHFTDNRVFVRVKPEITERDDLLRYMKQRLATLNYLASMQNNREVDAVIIFKTELTPDEYRSFMEQYGLTELNIMFKSYPEGIGVLSSEISAEKVREIEERIGQNYRGFKLIDSIVSVKTRIPARDLMKIQKDNRVFLVDAGPLEVYAKHSDKEVRVATDYIYTEYAKFGG